VNPHERSRPHLGLRFHEGPAPRSAGRPGRPAVIGEPGDAGRGCWPDSPVEDRPDGPQGLWIARRQGLTHAHQAHDRRTDLVIWAEEHHDVIGMIEAKAVIGLRKPFLVARPRCWRRRGMSRSDRSRKPVGVGSIDPVEVGGGNYLCWADAGCVRLTGSTQRGGRPDHPPANIYSDARRRCSSAPE